MIVLPIAVAHFDIGPVRKHHTCCQLILRPIVEEQVVFQDHDGFGSYVEQTIYLRSANDIFDLACFDESIINLLQVDEAILIVH